jgi:hypothetical protein
LSFCKSENQRRNSLVSFLIFILIKIEEEREKIRGIKKGALQQGFY